MVLVSRIGDEAATVDDLLVDRFEVTDGEFAAFLAATGYAPADAHDFLAHWPRVDGRPQPAEIDTPVRFVASADAEAYAEWRGKQLPTREEWLAACSSLTDGKLPWQPRAFTGVCNSVASGLDGPMPVGSYELGRSPAGCYDMVGNVAEWTVTPSFGPETRFLLGGSFLRHCVAADSDENSRFATAVSTRPDAFEDRLDPWLDRLSPELRRSDVGFRCVIRDARAVLEAAAGRVESLVGDARATALHELVAVDESDSDDNRMLARLRTRAFERRIAVTRTLASGEGDGFRGDVRVAPGGKALVVCEPGKLRFLDGRDGTPTRTIGLPFATETARSPWLTAPDGGDSAWVVGPRGEIALVDLASGRATIAPAPEGSVELDVSTDLVSDARADGAVWFVQQLPRELDAANSDADAGNARAPLPFTRVVRFGRGGEIGQRTLSGERYVTPPRAGADGLLLLTIDRLDIKLPIGDRDGVQRTSSAFAWVAAQLLAPDLTTRDEWLIADDLRLCDGGERLIWRFVARGEQVAAAEIDTAAGAQRYVVPLDLANAYVLDDGGGAPWLIHAAEGRIDAPRQLATVHAGKSVATAVAPICGGQIAAPFLVSLDGNQLWRIDPAEAPERLTGALALDEAPTFAACDPGAGNLLLGTRGGKWVGWSLTRREVVFERDSRGEATIDVELFAVADDAVVVSRPSTYVARIWRFAEGAPVDAIGLERTPIRSVLVLDADRDGVGEPWLSLQDGRLVRLAPPEPGSARLVEDFEFAVRRREVLRDGGDEDGRRRFP